jgi:nucleoside-diphosphate-sugar epimerase
VAAPAGAARTLRLLLDEMHAPAVAEALRADGHDVAAVAATPSLRGTSDEDLLAYAAVQQLVIVTENVVDFATIAARWATERHAHTGLIFTGPKRFNRSTLAYPGNLVVALRDLLRDPPDIGAAGTWWL